MKVSIFTDISVNHTEKVGGFAFYIGCKVGKIQKAGVIKQQIKNPTLGELQCIANALHTLKHSKFDGIEKVFLYTDSTNSIDAIGLRSVITDKAALPVLKEIRFLMMEICLKHGKPIRAIDSFFELKHVKGHTKGTDIYTTINRWCDAQAKKYMRKAVRKDQE